MRVYQSKRNMEGEVIVYAHSDASDTVARVVNGTFTSAIVKDAKYKKTIIWNLVIRDIDFSMVNYGAGVCRIIVKKKVE